MPFGDIDWKAALGNHRYRGGAFGWIFLVLMGAVNLFRGSVHLFAEDGGAERIAGIDLSQGGEVILTLFATMGLSQLLMAGIDLVVGLRFRALVPVVVAYHLVAQVGVSIIVWWHRPLPVEAPGKFGAVVFVPIAAIALYAALRERADSARVEAAPVGEMP